LRVTTLYASSAVATAAYYTRYLAETPGEEPGLWSGRQAEALGLVGQVAADDLQRLLEGRDPTTGPLANLPDNTSTSRDLAWLGEYGRLTETVGVSETIAMGARTYDSVIGRFLEIDPFEGGNENDYVYPADPVNGIDLNGSYCLTGVKRRVPQYKWVRPAGPPTRKVVWRRLPRGHHGPPGPTYVWVWPKRVRVLTGHKNVCNSAFSLAKRATKKVFTPSSLYGCVSAITGNGHVVAGSGVVGGAAGTAVAPGIGTAVVGGLGVVASAGSLCVLGANDAIP
jgi:RHS repeat-associated protein